MRFGKLDRAPHVVQWLSDNDPGYTTHGTVRFAHFRGLDVMTTPSHNPESNAMAAGFVDTFRRDYD